MNKSSKQFKFNKRIKLLLLVIFSFSNGLLIILNNGNDKYFHSVAQLIFDIFFILGILVLLPKRLFTFFHATLIVLIYAITFIDLYCFNTSGAYLSFRTIELILQTNPDEIENFFSSFKLKNIVSREMLVWVILLCTHLTCLLSINKLGKGLYRLCNHLKHTKKIVLACLLIFIIYISFVSIPIKYKFFSLLSQNNISDIESHIFRRNDQGAYNAFYRFLLSYRMHQIVIKESRKVKDMHRKIYVDNCTFRSPLIVLIIGESANKHHSQLYGYHLETTPKQLERKNQDELFVFNDVITPWNITSNVFNNVFSLYYYGSDKSWSEYPLFPLLFRQAGYNVSFLSNQYVKRRFSVNFNQAGGFFLEDEEWSETLFDVRNRRKTTYDEDFIKQDSIIPDDANRLIIYHLHGQHFSYDKRYPKEWKTFTTDDYNNRELTSEQKEIVAHYDNATLYNDYVVDCILNRFENDNAIVIYMPDHGEECYDDLPVHGRIHAAPTWRQVHQEFEIPFWIWCSDIYRETNSDITNLIKKAIDRPFMTDNLPYLLLYLAGINTNIYKEELNLISPNYDYNRKRMIEGIVDYDTLKKYKQP